MSETTSQPATVTHRDMFMDSCGTDRTCTKFEETLAATFKSIIKNNQTGTADQRTAAFLVCLLPQPTTDCPDGHKFYTVPFAHKQTIGEVIEYLNSVDQKVVIALDTNPRSAPFSVQFPHAAGTIGHPKKLEKYPVIATPTVQGAGVISMFTRKPL